MGAVLEKATVCLCKKKELSTVIPAENTATKENLKALKSLQETRRAGNTLKILSVVHSVTVNAASAKPIYEILLVVFSSTASHNGSCT